MSTAQRIENDHIPDPEHIDNLSFKHEENKATIKGDPIEAILKSSPSEAGSKLVDMAKNRTVSIEDRCKALEKIQAEMLKLEAKFNEEVHLLKCKYDQIYEPYLKKRYEIVNGDHEPTEEECKSVVKDEIKAGPSTDAKGQSIQEKKEGEKKNVKGIPGFWLEVFKKVDIIAGQIHEYDEPILDHLVDVRLKNRSNPMGFMLEFHFSPNEYFSDPILTKYYELKCKPDEENPLYFDGPEIKKVKGCEIHWKQGKNVTIEVVPKKRKHSSSAAQTGTKIVSRESFFRFFSPLQVDEDAEDMDDDEIQDLIDEDYEISEFIRGELIPCAVLYYTGEALEDEDSEESESEEDDEEDD